MLIKILGAIDFFAGIILLLNTSIKFPLQVFLIFGILLIAKSLINLLRDFASWIDFSVGIIFLFAMAFIIPTIICIILGLIIIQKSILSLVS